VNEARGKHLGDIRHSQKLSTTRPSRSQPVSMRGALLVLLCAASLAAAQPQPQLFPEGPALAGEGGGPPTASQETGGGSGNGEAGKLKLLPPDAIDGRVMTAGERAFVLQRVPFPPDFDNFGEAERTVPEHARGEDGDADRESGDDVDDGLDLSETEGAEKKIHVPLRSQGFVAEAGVDYDAGQFHWMANKMFRPELEHYLNFENYYARAAVSEDAQATLAQEMNLRRRVDQVECSCPERFSRQFWTFWCRSPNASFPAHYRQRASASDTRVILASPLDIDLDGAATGDGDDSGPPSSGDPDLLDADAAELIFDEEEAASDEMVSTYSLGHLQMSSAGRYLALGFDVFGDETYRVHIGDLGRQEVVDEVYGVGGSLAWGDSVTRGKKRPPFLFHDRPDPTTKRSYRIYQHKIGDAAKDDQLVFEEDDDRYSVSVRRCRSGKFVLLESHSSKSSHVRALPSNADGSDESAWKDVVPRIAERGAAVEHDSKTRSFLILTDDGGRRKGTTNLPLNPNRRLVVVNEALLGDNVHRNWRELLPHREDVYLEAVDAFQFGVIVTERFDGLSRLRVLPRIGKSGEISGLERSWLIDVPAVSGKLEVLKNPWYPASSVALRYSSFTLPPTVARYDFGSNSTSVVREGRVGGEFQSDDYESERTTVRTFDDERVPVSLVWKRGLGHRDTGQPGPTLLVGYGAYGVSLDAEFDPDLIPLLDRGVTVAFAHVRGGGEMGRKWYVGGKERNKRNSFTDFIAVADMLVRRGWTSHDRLAIFGKSAGGLLIAAALNMRPDLCRVAVAPVPFVDVLTTMMSPWLPLTTGEFEEWGNPNADEVVFKNLRTYSPVDNVKNASYPSILATAGLHDTRVGVWEPAKWIATLRTATTTSKEQRILLATHETGHFGGSGLQKEIQQTSFWMAFVLERLGVDV
jgi:oligopeptidase B